MPNLRALLNCLFGRKGHDWIYSHSRAGYVTCKRCRLRVKAP
jgi:hypothetical protein